MKAVMLLILGSMTAMSLGGGAAVSKPYEAYWLRNGDRGDEYVKLALTRVPLDELLTSAPSTNVPMLECSAVIVTTYAKDSIWNVDRAPFKHLIDVERVDTADRVMVIQGEEYQITQADLRDVVRLLKNPMGKIPIHRIHKASAGQEELIRALLKKLQSQVSDQDDSNKTGARD